MNLEPERLAVYGVAVFIVGSVGFIVVSSAVPQRVDCFGDSLNSSVRSVYLLVVFKPSMLTRDFNNTSFASNKLLATLNGEIVQLSARRDFFNSEVLGLEGYGSVAYPSGKDLKVTVFSNRQPWLLNFPVRTGGSGCFTAFNHHFWYAQIEVNPRG